MTLGAVALGARIIERHFTLDKSLKGSDHACSLDQASFAEMVNLVRILEAGLGSPYKEVQVWPISKPNLAVNSNPQPFEQESSAITTRPRYRPSFQSFEREINMLSMDQWYGLLLKNLNPTISERSIIGDLPYVCSPVANLINNLHS